MRWWGVTFFKPVEPSPMKRLFTLCAALCAGVFCVRAGDTEHTFRVTSLFEPERVPEFRAFMAEKFPEIAVLACDFETGEARLRVDPAKLKELSAVRTPELIRDKLASLLRGASRGVFDLLPLVDVPPEEVVDARIPIQGLDCRGCSYGVYRVVSKIDGVLYTAASFHAGEAHVRFDRRKTSLQAVEEELDKKRIATNYRPAEPGLVPPAEMRVVRCSSEETVADALYFYSTGHAANAIDGDPRTKWSTRYSGSEPDRHPHEMVIDLGKTRRVAGFRYLARQLGYGGQFGSTEFHVSNDPALFPDPPAVAVAFSGVKQVQKADCPVPVSGRYVRVRVLSEVHGKPAATAAEIAVLEAP